WLTVSGSIYCLAVFMMAFVSPAIIKRSRKHEQALLYWCCLAFCLFGFMPVFTDNFWVLFFWRFVIGFPAGLAFPVLLDMIGHTYESPEARQKVMNWASLSFSFQGLVYNLIAGFVARENYKYVFLVMLVILPIMGYALVVGPILEPEEGEGEEEEEGDGSDAFAVLAEGETEAVEGTETEGEGERETEAKDEPEVVEVPPEVEAETETEDVVPPFPLLAALWNAWLHTMSQGVWYMFIVLSSLHLVDDLEIEDSLMAGIAGAFCTVGMMLGAMLVSPVKRGCKGFAGPVFFGVQAVGTFLTSTNHLYLVLGGASLVGIGTGANLALLLAVASSFHKSHRPTVSSLYVGMQNFGMVGLPSTVALFPSPGDTLFFGGLLSTATCLIWTGVECRNRAREGKDTSTPTPTQSTTESEGTV
ncbi:major facilitator superfamily protein, partial [Kipferlia bialata]